MTKAQALEIFRAHYLPTIPKHDTDMKCEEWNNYTDSLRRQGDITERQYETWSNPF